LVFDPPAPPEKISIISICYEFLLIVQEIYKDDFYASKCGWRAALGELYRVFDSIWLTRR